MSLWVGAGGGRARSPRRSAAPDRRPMHGRSKLYRCYRAGVGPLGSRRRSADFEETRVALITPAGRSLAAMSGFAALLLIADHRQYCPQPLVVGDRTLVDLLDLVEGAVGQLDTPIADRQPAVGVVDDSYALADRRLGLLARFHDEEHLVVLQRQRLREGAFLFPGKRILQIVAGAQWAVQILAVRRQLGKAHIVVGGEPRQQGIALRQASCPGQPQLLDQPVLQGLVRALDPPLGRARIGADDVDVERVQSPAKLGHPVTAERPRMVDPEDAVLEG